MGASRYRLIQEFVCSVLFFAPVLQSAADLLLEELQSALAHKDQFKMALALRDNEDIGPRVYEGSFPLALGIITRPLSSILAFDATRFFPKD